MSAALKFGIQNTYYCSCAHCDVEFKFPSEIQATALAGGTPVYCPYGHTNYWSRGKSKTELLKEQLQAKERELASKQCRIDSLISARESEKRSHAATKGKLTKVTKRIQKGVCLCCNRHFENLERHMKTKHPEEK